LKILQGNIDHNANIQLLQERWPCRKHGCGTYHFINAKQEHVLLSHARMEVWAMVMVSPSFSSVDPVVIINDTIAIARGTIY
jgi:hypothetical protein